MTKEEAIKYLKQIYPNGGGTWLDEQRIEAINMAINALEEPAAWSEEDERMMLFCCDYLDDNQKSWLLSLKERYT